MSAALRISIAGEPVDDPIEVWRRYAHHQAMALRDYDGPGRGDADVLRADEVWRTRKINTRVNYVVRDQVVAAWRTPEAAAIPADAHIRDADPAEHGGLYDAAQQLTGLLRSVKGVGWTTAYKVLHIKRPSLFPLLDARLRQTYRQAEAEWRTDHPSVRPGGRNFWAVIRADVIDPFNRSSLERARETFRRESPLRPLTGLSDVRLLDILAWRLAGPNGS